MCELPCFLFLIFYFQWTITALDPLFVYILFLHPLIHDYKECSTAVQLWINHTLTSYDLSMSSSLNYCWTSSIIRDNGVVCLLVFCLAYITVTEWIEDCWKEFQSLVWVTQSSYKGVVLSACQLLIISPADTHIGAVMITVRACVAFSAA